jgi:hypothetical protein
MAAGSRYPNAVGTTESQVKYAIRSIVHDLGNPRIPYSQIRGLPIRRARRKVERYVTQNPYDFKTYECVECERTPTRMCKGDLRHLCRTCRAKCWAKAMRRRRWLSRNKWDAFVIPVALTLIVIYAIAMGCST